MFLPLKSMNISSSADLNVCVCVYKNIYTFMYLYINIYIKQQVKTEVFIGHICLNFDSKLGLFSTLLNSRFQMF